MLRLLLLLRCLHGRVSKRSATSSSRMMPSYEVIQKKHSSLVGLRRVRTSGGGSAWLQRKPQNRKEGVPRWKLLRLRAECPGSSWLKSHQGGYKRMTCCVWTISIILLASIGGAIGIGLVSPIPLRYSTNSDSSLRLVSFSRQACVASCCRRRF